MKMNHVVWIAFTGMTALFLELLLANAHWPFPVLALTCYYISLVYGIRSSVIPFLFFASLVDIMPGRPVPFTPLLAAVAAGLALVWRHHGDSRSYAAQLLPGLILGISALTLLGVSMAATPSLFLGTSYGNLAFGLIVLFLSTVLGTPAVCALWDNLAVRLRLPRSVDIQKNRGQA